MSQANPSYKEQMAAELRRVPDEYMPALISIVHAFRESVEQKQFKEELQESFLAAKAGKTYPIETLWDDIERE